MTQSYSLNAFSAPNIRIFRPEMNNTYYPQTHPILRILKIPSIFTIGIIIKITIDVILNLKFRNYPLFENGLVYLGAGFIAWLIYQSLKTINDQLNYSFPWDRNPVRRFFIQALVDVTLSIVLIALFRVMIAYFNWENTYVNVIEEFVNLIVVGVFTLLFVVGDLSYFLVNRWRVSLAELESFKKENLAFEFGMLKTQINPHFLFNSLNTLSGLVHTNADMASEFIRQLSRLYRNLLKEKENIHSLEKELELLNSYTYLVGLRFSNNLHISINIVEKYKSLNIAPLSLQMLIENAIKHNVISAKKPLYIEIKSIDDNKIEVMNNLQPKLEKEESTEIGLKNIQKRYEFLTDRKVEIQSAEDKFKVIIPLI
ncbi:histidine kinase [Hyphobacterium sp. CCMP332]|nr:histidine kinase [Hyphobacterium sp. CCMP332]